MKINVTGICHYVEEIDGSLDEMAEQSLYLPTETEAVHGQHIALVSVDKVSISSRHSTMTRDTLSPCQDAHHPSETRLILWVG